MNVPCKPLSLAIVALFCSGCNKQPASPPPPPLDAYGYPAADLAYVYTRASGIRIDFPTTLNPEQEFTDAEIALIVQALDTLTDDELASLHLHVILPDEVPGSTPQMFYRPDLNLLHIVFGQPKTGRPIDPNLGNKVLIALGFTPRIPNPKTEALLRVGPGSLVVVSPKTPTSYTPLLSPAGLGAASAEERMTGQGNEKTLTLDDQIRPHGNAVVVSPSTKFSPKH